MKKRVKKSEKNMKGLGKLAAGEPPQLELIIF